MGGGGGQGGCERRIEVFVKIQKKIGGGGSGRGGGVRDQVGGRVGGIRIVKIQKKNYFFFYFLGGGGLSGRGRGVRVDVTEK